MTSGVTFFGSTIGQKVVMALTGVVLFGFVFAHMIGNLQVYLGPHALNEYGVFLREVLHGTGLWIARARASSRRGPPHLGRGHEPDLDEPGRPAPGLPGRAAPGVDLRLAHHGLERTDPARSSSSTTSPHLTWGTAHPTFIEGDVYHNLVAGFSRWPVSAFYIVAMLALGLHLYHGVWSLLQTLGAQPPALERPALRFRHPLHRRRRDRQHLDPGRRAGRAGQVGTPWN